MKRMWVVFFIAVIAAGSFLWNGRIDVPGWFMFDNMRAKNEEDAIPPPNKALPGAIGDASYRKNASSNSSLVFASGGSSYFQTGRMAGKFGDILPPEMGGIAEAASVAEKGKLVYRKHCAVCHGVSGDGKGRISTYEEFPVISAFWSDKYKNYPMGKIFNSIAHGQGNMPAFAERMTVREIWEAVRWVTELQTKRGEERTNE